MRLLVAVAVAMVCLISGWTTTFAQGATGPPSIAPDETITWAYVTGREESCSDQGWEPTVEAGVLRGRMEFNCITRLSDPRVSGPVSGDYSFACARSGDCLYWGSYEITGPGGTWVGSWSGVDEPAGGASFNVTTEGTGGYAGWTFMAVLRDPLDGSAATMHGLVFEGPPPPWDVLATSDE